ncbi:VanZ family protein [Chitinophagaceae bacterium LWZ2-11]
MKLNYAKFIPAILGFIATLILLILPGSDIPKAQWLDDIHADKIVHIGMFASIVFLWCWPLKKSGVDVRKKRNWFLFVTISAIAYGVAMEFVQKYFIPNRSFDVYDMIADGAGAVAGYIWSRIFFID